MEREAVERLDILEYEFPKGTCAVRGCQRNSPYPIAGTWRTFSVCSRHLPLYRRHRQILQRIRSL